MAKVFSLMSRLYGEVKKNGVSNTYYKVMEKQAKNQTQKDYEEERLAALPQQEEFDRQTKILFMKDLTFSIVVPAYETPALYLKQMIESVLGQTFCRVELCIADGSRSDAVEKTVSVYASTDSRIRYQRLEENKGISENTNAALAMATGDYIGLLDHDDLLERHALFEMRMAIAKNPKADVLYSDEDKVSFDLTRYFEPHFKPDYNPDLLRSNNYICHFLVFKRTLLETVGGFRQEFDGAQDYDLVLRLTEAANCVVHVPKVLYHWRSHEASTATNPMSKLYAYEAGRRAVEAHLKRCGEEGVVSDTRFYGFYQTVYKVPEELSVDFMVYGCNGENHKKILNIFSPEFHRQTMGNVIYYDNEFNKFVIFAKEQKLGGQVLLFVKADLLEKEPEELIQLAANCLRDGIGMAGGRILSEKGVLVGGRMEPEEDGKLSYADAGLAKGFTGYFHKAILQQNTKGVPFELFAIRRELFEKWDPKGYASSEEAMQELCAFVESKGFRITYVPSVTGIRKS